MPSRINPNRTSPPRPPANQDDARPAAAAPVEPVPTNNPGVSPSGAVRQTALQAALIRQVETAQVAPQSPPQLRRLGLWESAVRDWVTEDGGRFEDVRGHVSDRIHSFHRDSQMPLDTMHEPRRAGLLSLNGMGLTSLPSLFPPAVERLDLSFNRLTSVTSRLSSRLTELNLDNNQLAAVPDNLPRNLQRLSVRDNQIEDVSPAVIHRLAQLGESSLIDLRGNPLAQHTRDDLEQMQDAPDYDGPQFVFTRPAPALVPRPSALRRRDAAEGQMAAPSRAPELPQARDIAAGHADRNRLTPLPDVPVSLQRLNIVHNQLTSLPANLPASLLSLDVSPRSAAEGAQAHDHAAEHLNHNPLTALPEFPVTPPRPEVSQRLQVAPSLSVSVAAWTPGPLAGVAATSRLWAGFSAEPGATAFAEFLDGLRDTVNFESPQFRSSVTEWLSRLETDPALRGDTFTLSVGATESCEDRVSHTFNRMRQLRLTSDVAGGAYDERLPELLTLARGMFRLDQLETISAEHARAIPDADEVEVYLGYQVMLRERLALPLDTADMRWFVASDVTPEDLDRAEVRVVGAEQEGFANYLSSHWQPWQAVLQRLAPNEHAQAQGQLMEAMGEEFHNRLNARLQEAGLENDADAQRNAGPQVQAEITHEINGRLTREFLASRGLLNLIESLPSR